MTVDLRLGDCLEVIKSLPTASIDAVITDPPFFTPAVHYQSRVSWGRCLGDLSILGQFFFDLAVEWKRVIKSDGHLLVFCHDESYPVFYPVTFGMWDSSKALVWDKTRIGLGRTFRHQFELILWAHDKQAYTNEHGKVHSNVLKYSPTLSKDRDHPVQKPPELIRELIEVCTRTDATILDCFMGSGTTGEACVNLGRNFIGVEINEGYFNISKKRIEEAQQQLAMNLG